jgi:Uma2 family endonuclease
VDLTLIARRRFWFAMPDARAYVAAMSPASLTADDLLHVRIPDKRVELVRGQLVVREPAGYRHGRVAMNLALQLGTHLARTGAGQLFAAETGFTLARAPDTVRAPDIAFIRRERLPDHEPVGFPDLAPDLVAEVLSPEDRPGEVLAKVADWLSTRKCRSSG